MKLDLLFASFLALLVFAQQSYCHGAGVRSRSSVIRSSVRRPSVNSGFSEIIA